MGKKKKTSAAAPAIATAADGTVNATADGSASAASATSATAAAAAKASAPAPPQQPWASNYEGMKIVPIVADPFLVRATDSLAQKVNSQTIDLAPASSAASASEARRFQFGIFTSTADTAGRRAIALRAIPAGTLLLSERGQPWIAHAEHADKVCHTCAKCLYDPRIISPKTTPDGQKAPSRHLHCDECDAAFYCSSACQTAHKAVHALECPALQQSEEISDLAKTNVDLVRAAIKYVVAKATAPAEDSAAASSSSSSASDALAYDPYAFLSTPADCELLMDHLSEASPMDLRNMRDAAALVLKSLSPDLASKVPADRVVAFLGRLNSNCHSLNLEEHATIQFGFGLYPLCAQFNHSCLPNCIFVNEGSNLTFRVIRDVAEHEELTVNYIGLYAPRTVRRKELWVTKKFFCQCRRCNLRPKNEEERSKFALDAQLGGVSCQAALAVPAASSSSSSSSSASSAKSAPAAAAPKCPGYYRINYQMLDPKAEAERKRKRREEKEKKRAAAAASSTATVVEIDTSKPLTSTVVAEAKEDGSSSSTTAAAPVAPAAAASDSDSDDEEDDENDFPLSLRPKVTSARCTVCGHNGNRTSLTAVQAEALDRSEALLSMYGSGSKTPQQVKDEFEAFLKLQTPLLAEQHGVLFNLLLPLVNVTSALAEWKAKLDYCKRVVLMAESVFPRHFLPTCNYYQALSNTYRALLVKGLKDQVPRKMLLKYKEENVAVLTKLAESMKICRGKDHLLTQAAARDVEVAKKFSLTIV